MKDLHIPAWLYGLFGLLLVPALLINLGLMTFIDDEGIRTLVALEMDFSGNWITPTLHGEYYYKKPPLFNWILLGWFYLTGKVSEFTARIPTVVALLGYCGTIYYFLRKHTNSANAFLHALVVLTCGRILFWDSMLALIDITFSWVMYGLFMVTYHAFEKERWTRLFVLTYALTAMGFLLKGLPAVVFQGFTLLAYFSYRGAFRRLFSWQHLLGGLVFVLTVGGYYGVYHQYNDLNNVFRTLVTESSQRTVVNYGIWNTVKHVFTFPLEMTYHFLPWSIMVVYLVHRRVLGLLRADRFIAFNALVFLANILIYWTSPEVYPRYLLMLAPLLFTVFLHLHAHHRSEQTWQYKGVSFFLALLMVVMVLVWWAPPFLERTDIVDHRWWKAWSVAVVSTGLGIAYRKMPNSRLVILGLALLAFRIGFNFFVLPDRNANDYGDLCRERSIAVGEAYQDRPLYVYSFETEMQMTNSAYLTAERKAIIPVVAEPQEPDALYIIDPLSLPDLSYQVVDSIFLRHGKRTYYIGQFTKPTNTPDSPSRND